jgi:DeoR/GlpR family transcriptional regulator of sugar metabolism
LRRIVEDTFDSPFVRVATLAKKLDVTYPTAKADIGKLVSAGILRALHDVNPKTYYAHEVFNVAYSGIDSGTTREKQDAQEQETVKT